MPNYSIYKKAIMEEKKDKAVALFTQGYTLREAGDMVGLSYETVRQHYFKKKRTGDN